MRGEMKLPLREHDAEITPHEISSPDVDSFWSFSDLEEAARCRVDCVLALTIGSSRDGRGESEIRAGLKRLRFGATAAFKSHLGSTFDESSPKRRAPKFRHIAVRLNTGASFQSQASAFAALELLAMPSLLLVVFILQLFIHLVNTVGAPVIDEFVSADNYTFCSSLPMSKCFRIGTLLSRLLLAF